MCPMRIFLILFSAALGSYIAWRNYTKSEDLRVLHESEEQQSEDSKTVDADGSTTKQQISSKLSSAFWVLVDMATGRHLWRSLKSFDAAAESKKR